MDVRVELSSGSVCVRRWGDVAAPAVVCVHGLSANLTAFSWLAEGLVRAGNQIITFDCRGRGRSPDTGPGSYGVDAHARDVLELAERLELERFDLIGWSMGAVIGMLVASLAPERLRSLALLDHAGPMDPEAVDLVRAGLARLDARVGRPEEYLELIRGRGLILPWTPFWSAHYRYELAQRDDGGWSPSTSRTACTEDLEHLDADWPQLWSGLTMPTTLVCTTAPIGGGLIVPASAREAFRDGAPGARVIETQVNHYTLMTDPVMLTAVVANLACGA